MKELLEKIKELQIKIKDTWAKLDLDKTKIEIKSLEYEMAQPDFWNDQDRAKKKSKKLDEFNEELDKWQSISKELGDLSAMVNESLQEDDNSIKPEAEKKYSELLAQFDKLEFYLMLSGEHDQQNAIVAIHSGTGGVDAQDWSAMLLRMYLRFAEKRGWIVKVLDKSMGTEAGIKSVTFQVEGRYAYGYLKSEAGVHRLVRISPFDAEKMRHTSFALVEVLPELDDTVEVNIKDDDIRIDTFMASGHGGQSVNTTYSAVRIVHQPTGITVSCQNERSQLQNKETAMKILKSKLHQLYLDEKIEEKDKLRGEYQEAAWGNQARSYVIHPYKMVKDHRTKHETNEVNKVLDGELDEFIESYLKDKIK
ncbi:MAG: peptide chain release factor 2 [bacterium]|nr:peptide chain release factor 2 [bacterium]